MIAFILKVSLCWLFFYGIYELFLKQRTFFNANRSYLLITLIAGIVLPLLEFIPWKNESNVAHVIYPVLVEIDDLQAVVAQRQEDKFNWIYILNTLYVIGFLVSFSKFFIGIKRILKLFNQSKRTVQKGYTLVITNEHHLPFSFFKWVFLSKKITLSQDIDKILTHEIEHIKGKHSLDVLATEFLKVVFWCSPMIYLYRNAIKEVHEYLADHVVIKNSDKLSYKKLLLEQTNSSLQMALTHQFFNSHLKNRIKMINQKRSGRPTLVMYALGIPVLLLLLFAFTYTFNSDDHPSADPELIENIGSYFMEENPEKAPYFQINGEDIELPLYNHISLYGNIGNAIVLLPEDAVAKFGPRAKLGYINFENPHLKKGREYDGYIDIRKHIKLRGNLRRATHEIMKESGTVNQPVKRDFIPSAGKKMKAALLAGIKKNLDETSEIKEVYTGKISKEYDQIARFPGCEDKGLNSEDYELCGLKEMYKVVYNHLKYPERAQKNGLYGTVSISFVVTEEGKLTNFNIYSDIGGDCGKAALEACKKLKEYEWLPALKDGSPVAIMYLLPVGFELTPEIADAYKKIEVKVDTVPSSNSTNSSSSYPMEIFKVVEEMPRFPGCEEMDGSDKEKERCAKEKMLQYIYSNIKYPKVDRDAGVEGMAVVQFVIKKDGTISHPEVVRSLSKTTDAELLRVVESMNVMEGRWKPGIQKGKEVNIMYTIPVRFKLEGEENGEKKEESQVEIADPNNMINLTELETEAKPIIYVDGELFDGEIEEIKAEMIKEIHVWKGEKAVKKYGEEAVNGVVEVSIKKEGSLKIESEEGIHLNAKGIENEPLFVIDGEIQTNANREKLNPDDIESVNVLKGEKAIEKYGDKGLNGVVDITTKKGDYAKLSEDFDTPAYFPGCEDSSDPVGKEQCSKKRLLEYVYANVKYPKAAAEKGVEGMVVTSFIIDNDGKIRNIKLKRETEGLSKSALEAIAKMADEVTWEPAMKEGNPVAMEFTLPIKYKLPALTKVEAKYTDCEKIEDAVKRQACMEEKKEVVKQSLEALRLDNEIHPRLILQDISIFPNPARESVNIQFTGAKKPLNVQILNIEGKSIYSQNFPLFDGKFDEKIELKNIDSKMFLVRIEQEGLVYTEKLVIE